MRTCSPRLMAPARGAWALRATVYSLSAALAVAVGLCCWGCGRELIPIPIPCPACEDTAESRCREFQLDDGTRLRSQYSPGDPNFPLLINIPGFGGSLDDVTLAFPKGTYPALSFSLPGQRCSDKLPTGTPYSIAIGTDALEQLMEHHQDLLAEFGDDNVLLIGASFGAFIVADYCARHPQNTISAVLIVGQDTPPNGTVTDVIASYLKLVTAMFPLTDNIYLQQYLDSARDFDVSAALARTNNRWLIIGAANDELAPDSRATADRLGERAHYAEVLGGHFDILQHVAEVRQIVTDELGFLLAGR